MVFPKSVALLTLLAAALFGAALLVMDYFQGGLETCFPPPKTAQLVIAPAPPPAMPRLPAAA